MRYKAELEELLTTELRKSNSQITHVAVSFDGQFAIYNVADRYALKKLSPAAKGFLQNGDRELLKECLFL